MQGGRGGRQHPRPRTCLPAGASPDSMPKVRRRRQTSERTSAKASHWYRAVASMLARNPSIPGRRKHGQKSSFRQSKQPHKSTCSRRRATCARHKPNHARRGLTTPNAGRRALSEGRHTFSAGRRAPTQADTSQRGPTRVQRGPRNVYKEGFSRFAARIACFPKVSFGTDQQIPIGPKATTLSPGIIFSAFVSARERAPAPRQPNGKDLENSHFETRSADFLPKARDRTPRRLSPGEPGVTHPERRHDRSRIAAATHPKKRRCASSPHLRNRRRRRAQRRALRLPALRIGVKNGDRVDAVAPEGYGSRT